MMKNNIQLLILFAFLFVSEAKAQIHIGSDAQPDASAALQISANGAAVSLLLPRLTTTERGSIKSPTAGLVIYNSITNSLQVATSSSLWVDLLTATTTSVASGTNTSAGKVGIGTITPNANAVLDVTSTTKGVLLPQSTTNPTGIAGMIYYNTTSDSVQLYNGTSWVTLTN